MTFNPPGLKTFMMIAIGFGLHALSHVLERAGDFASEPGLRLFNHITALAVLVAADICLIWAFKMMFFDKPREKAPPAITPTPKPQHVDIYAEQREADNFDPDAALARYMSSRSGADPDRASASGRPASSGRNGATRITI